MAAQAPPLEAVSQSHSGNVPVLLLAATVLLLIDAGLWLMGAPGLAVAQVTVGLGALLWLRARLAGGVA